ncbi:MAG TPA: GNAT family N-acetyltransferase [Candidatus Cloacimonadota bacterium]|nr:GNAT family N-acetyltransferase [Candidatus Cloacimonadota bacterium]HPT73128.1 GNAT family N-acetyltransferase [Candidatus Cloacimonadota bacterium]
MAMEFPLHSQPDFMNTFAKAYQLDSGCLVAYDEDEPAGFLPIFIRKKFGLSSVVNPQLYYYHHITFKLETGMHPNRMMQRKLDICRELSAFMKKNFQKIFMNLAPSVCDVRGFTWSKLQAVPLYTFLIPLKTIDPSDYFKNERNLLNKAARDGVRIEEGKNIAEFLRLMRMTVHRQKIMFAISEDSHVQLLEELFNHGFVRQFNAYINDKIVATFLILMDKSLDTVYAWQHYTDPSHFSSGVSPFFMDRLFHLLKDEFSIFDYCGANHPAISRYKAAMGADLHLFFRIQGNVLTWK